jgi:PIN domain nuclease of toxin-antitoxin system
MRFLVDTHTLLWALGEPSSLSSAAREAISDPASLIVVSSASLWECAIKASIGKLDLPEDFLDSIPEAGYEFFPPTLYVLHSDKSHSGAVVRNVPGSF